MVGWVSSARHSLGTGTVPPHFAPEIAPDLLQLRSQLTKYKLGQASALRSIYSWRLLELLAQYEASGWRQINWTSFTTRCPPDSYRIHVKNCRRWVVEPAVKELREKDGWLIDWHPVKAEWKVIALRFEFKRDA